MNSSEGVERPRRRFVDIGDEEFGPERVMVVKRGKALGFVARWTRSCSGCTPGYEEVGYCPDRGGGCFECGYTGRRREVMWMVLPKEVQRKLLAEAKS